MRGRSLRGRSLGRTSLRSRPGGRGNKLLDLEEAILEVVVTPFEEEVTNGAEVGEGRGGKERSSSSQSEAVKV